MGSFYKALAIFFAGSLCGSGLAYAYLKTLPANSSEWTSNVPSEQPTEGEALEALRRKLHYLYPAMTFRLRDCTVAPAVVDGVICVGKVNFLPQSTEERPLVRSVGFSHTSGQWEVSLW